MNKDEILKDIEFKRINGFYDNIVDVLQEHINHLSTIEYDWDKECKPKFTISVMSEPEGDYIIMTIEHLERQFSEKVFPRTDSHYGYDTLYNMMINLFNRTM